MEVTTVTGFVGLESAQNAFADLAEAIKLEGGDLSIDVVTFERTATPQQILLHAGLIGVLAVGLHPPTAVAVGPAAVLAMGCGIALAIGVACYAVLNELGSPASVHDVINASQSLSRQTAKYFDDKRPDLKGVVSSLQYMLGDGLRSVRDRQAWSTEDNGDNQAILFRRYRDALFALVVHKTPNQDESIDVLERCERLLTPGSREMSLIAWIQSRRQESNRTERNG